MHRRMSLNYSMLDAVKENDMDLVKELLNYEATEVNFRDEVLLNVYFFKKNTYKTCLKRR